jgi:DNA repair exonuclease SbcCD ATPase subunit
MIQSAEYNKGRPYFVSFRPLLHHHHKLSDETLEKYGVYNKRLDEIYEILQKYKVVGSDVFDFELELNLAVENLKRGLFDVLELYLESLEPKIQEHFNTLDDNQKREFARLQEEDKLFVSRSKDAEEKIEKEIEDLSLLKKEQRNEDYWKRKLDEERKKIEEELTTEREEIAMIVDRLNKIKKIVKDKEEIKTKLDDIRRNIEGEVKNDGKSS